MGGRSIQAPGLRFTLLSYQVAIDLDHLAAAAEPRAAPKCSSRSAPDRPPATANDIIHRAKTFSDPAATSYGLDDHAAYDPKAVWGDTRISKAPDPTIETQYDQQPPATMQSGVRINHGCLPIPGLMVTPVLDLGEEASIDLDILDCARRCLDAEVVSFE